MLRGCMVLGVRASIHIESSDDPLIDLTGHPSCVRLQLPHHILLAEFIPVLSFSFVSPSPLLCRSYMRNKTISKIFQPSSTSIWNSFISARGNLLEIISNYFTGFLQLMNISNTFIVMRSWTSWTEHFRYLLQFRSYEAKCVQLSCFHRGSTCLHSNFTRTGSFPISHS